MTPESRSDRLLRALMLPLVIAACSGSASGCAQAADKAFDPARVTRVVYRFQDSSVPPEFHRSKTLTATPEQLTEEIDSYGKVLSERQVPLSSDQYAGVVQALQRHRIRLVEREPAGPCTGGTSELVKVFEAETPVFDASVYHCNADSGNLGGDVAAFRKELERLLGEEPAEHR